MQCWRLPLPAQRSPAPPAAREPPGSFFPRFFFFFLLFIYFFSFWNSVQHKHRVDPRGCAAIQRRWLVLCQTLRWGKAGGNPFCNVSAGAAGNSHVRCSIPGQACSPATAAPKGAAQSGQSTDLSCPTSARSLLYCRFAFCSP